MRLLHRRRYALARLAVAGGACIDPAAHDVSYSPARPEAARDASLIDRRVRRRARSRRVVEVIGATTHGQVALPLVAVAALLVCVEDRGPWLYRQERVGRNGRPFVLLKLRTMRMDAEADGQPRWACSGDPRVTRVGAFLRRMRIDELPQLVNVLRGEMSLIGPRPERACFVRELERELPGYALRHLGLPGLTGYAQVFAGYAGSRDEARVKLELDLYYLANQSLALDLAIAARTIGVVLTGEGAR
jgi:lipopolysaccharide/colanic/teichoic acid biosynthesis glycosyltransferase